MTAPLSMLSSILMEPCMVSMYSLTIGSPDPTPFMVLFISAVADEKPGFLTFCLSAIPGPWSANLMVLPLFMIVTTTSEKYECMKFSAT